MMWPIPPARLGPRLLNCGCNEVDEVDRPQPGGAGCGHYFPLDLRRRCASRSWNHRSTLRRDRAAEFNGFTKKFQQHLCPRADTTKSAAEQIFQPAPFS